MARRVSQGLQKKGGGQLQKSAAEKYQSNTTIATEGPEEDDDCDPTSNADSDSDSSQKTTMTTMSRGGDAHYGEESDAVSAALLLHDFDLMVLAKIVSDNLSLRQLHVHVPNFKEFAGAVNPSAATIEFVRQTVFVKPPRNLDTFNGLQLTLVQQLLRDELQSLDFSGQNLRDFEALLLLPFLKESRRLRNLDLRGNFLTMTVAESFVDFLLNPGDTWLTSFCALPVAAIAGGETEELELSHLCHGEFECFVLSKLLAAGPKVVKYLYLAGLQLESRATLAAQAFVDMLDNYPGLVSVSGVPVQDLKDDRLLNLHLPSGVLGNVEALVLAHLLQSNRNLKRLILGAQQTGVTTSLSNDSGSSIVQMWKAAVIVFTAVEASPNAKLNVSLWGNIVRKQDCARMRVLMEGQLRERQDEEDNLELGAEAGDVHSDDEAEGDKQFEEFEDTPLARLCLIPIHRIEKNLISEVSLKDTGMTDFEIMILADLLKGNRSIRSLDLRGNPKMSETALQLLLEPLLKHKKLQIVSDMPFKALRNMRTLNFEDKMLGDFEVLLLGELLKMGSKVKVMNLKGNKFSHKATAKMLASLREIQQIEHVSDVPILEIRRNKILDLNLKNRKLGDFEAFLLADVLKLNRSMHNLTIGGNNFRSREAAEKLCAAILAHPTLDRYNHAINITSIRFRTLQRLELASQRPALSDFDAMVISGFLVQCEQIRHIDMSRNKIGNVGFTAFRGILSQLKQLEFLDIHGNHRLNSSMFQQLLEALLESNLKDAEVNLIGYTIYSSEFETIRAAIDNDLSGVKLSTQDVKTICQAIRNIPFIYALDLRSTNLNREQTLSVLQAVESSPVDQFVINFWGYEIMKPTAPALRELLDRCRNDEVDIFQIATQMGTMNSKIEKNFGGRFSRSQSITSHSGAPSVHSLHSAISAQTSGKQSVQSGQTAPSLKESQGSG